jgi:hypothetical protein
VAEGDAVDFELELVGFDKAPNWDALPGDAKVARAEALKEQGNRLFRRGPPLVKHAAQKWTKAVQLLDHAFDLDTPEQVRAPGPGPPPCCSRAPPRPARSALSGACSQPPVRAASSPARPRPLAARPRNLHVGGWPGPGRRAHVPASARASAR